MIFFLVAHLGAASVMMLILNYYQMWNRGRLLGYIFWVAGGYLWAVFMIFNNFMMADLGLFVWMIGLPLLVFSDYHPWLRGKIK